MILLQQVNLGIQVFHKKSHFTGKQLQSINAIKSIVYLHIPSQKLREVNRNQNTQQSMGEKKHDLIS